MGCPHKAEHWRKELTSKIRAVIWCSMCGKTLESRKTTMTAGIPEQRRKAPTSTKKQDGLL